MRKNQYLIPPNTLRRLAGMEPESPTSLLESYTANEYDDLTDGQDSLNIQVESNCYSIEIITLAQHKYELAFESVASDLGFDILDPDEIDPDFFDPNIMEEKINSILHVYGEIKPHISVGIDTITIVLDCTKVDQQIMLYAATLLERLPSKEVGFYWEI